MRKFLLPAGIVLMAVLASALPSRADSVANFSVEQFGLTFSLPDTFTPSMSMGNAASVNNVPGTLFGSGVFDYGAITLGTSGFMGMTNYWFFGSITPGFSGPQAGFFSPSLVTFNADGTVTINPGVYTFGAVGGPSITLDVTTTTTGDGNGGGVTTPEPASLTLLGMGGLALMGLRRRKTA